MNHLLSQYLLLPVAAILLFVSMSSHSTVILEIDESQSSFSKKSWFCATGCNGEAAFDISDTFGVNFDVWNPNIDLITMSAIDIRTTLPSGQTFEFPQYPVAFENGAFAGNGNPCNYWPFPGSCSSQGNFGGLSGTYDGLTMALTGVAPIDNRYSYHFDILARVVTVPIPSPGTSLLLALALVPLMKGAFRRRIGRHMNISGAGGDL